MKHTISAAATTSTDVDDAITVPGIYGVQNVGTVDLYWSRVAGDAALATGHKLAAGAEVDLYLDGRAGSDARLYLRVGSGTVDGDVRIDLKTTR